MYPRFGCKMYLRGAHQATLQGREAEGDVLPHGVLHQLAAAVAGRQLRQQAAHTREARKRKWLAGGGSSRVVSAAGSMMSSLAHFTLSLASRMSCSPVEALQVGAHHVETLQQVRGAPVCREFMGVTHVIRQGRSKASRTEAHTGKRRLLIAPLQSLALVAPFPRHD